MFMLKSGPKNLIISISQRWSLQMFIFCLNRVDSKFPIYHTLYKFVTNMSSGYQKRVFKIIQTLLPEIEIHLSYKLLES